MRWPSGDRPVATSIFQPYFCTLCFNVEPSYIHRRNGSSLAMPHGSLLLQSRTTLRNLHGFTTVASVQESYVGYVHRPSNERTCVLCTTKSYLETSKLQAAQSRSLSDHIPKVLQQAIEVSCPKKLRTRRLNTRQPAWEPDVTKDTIQKVVQVRPS